MNNDLGHAKQILEEALLKAEEKYGTTSQVEEEIHFTGELRNGAQRRLSSNVEKFIKLSIIELDESQYDIEYDEGKWNVDLTLDEPGQYACTLKMEYDDTQSGDPLGGVSQFYAQIPLYADINPNPIPDPTPDSTPKPNQLHAFMEQLAQKPYLLLVALVIVGLILLIVRHFRRHKFEVIFRDGTVKTIYATKDAPLLDAFHGLLHGIIIFYRKRMVRKRV